MRETVSYFVNDSSCKDFTLTPVTAVSILPKDNQAGLQRRFYNEDGSTAYDMIVGDNNQDIYRFLIRFFMVSKNSFAISSNV